MSINLEVASLIMTAAAVFVTSYTVLSVLLLPRVDLEMLTNQQRARVRLLRSRSPFYRLFEPILARMTENQWVRRITHFDRIRTHIASGACHLPFQPCELAAIVMLRGLLFGVAVSVLLLLGGNIFPGLFAGLVIVLGYPTIHAFRANAATNDQLNQIVKRLPHATNLLAMQLTAGSSFRQAFALITHELKEHALGEEFSRIIRDTEHGMSMREALDGLMRRLPNSDIKDFVGSIQSSQKRGTPLAKTLCNLAEQMRVRRTQRAERAAGRAQANITFPGLVIMGSCLLILLTPFVLQAIEENPFDY